MPKRSAALITFWTAGSFSLEPPRKIAGITSGNPKDRDSQKIASWVSLSSCFHVGRKSLSPPLNIKLAISTAWAPAMEPKMPPKSVLPPANKNLLGSAYLMFFSLNKSFKPGHEPNMPPPMNASSLSWYIPPSSNIVLASFFLSLSICSFKKSSVEEGRSNPNMDVFLDSSISSICGSFRINWSMRFISSLLGVSPSIWIP